MDSRLNMAVSGLRKSLNRYSEPKRPGDRGWGWVKRSASERLKPNTWRLEAWSCRPQPRFFGARTSAWGTGAQGAQAACVIRPGLAARSVTPTVARFLAGFTPLPPSQGTSPEDHRLTTHHCSLQPRRVHHQHHQAYSHHLGFP